MATPKPKKAPERGAVTWRFPPKMLKRIRELADRQHRSINAQAEALLEAGLRVSESNPSQP